MRTCVIPAGTVVEVKKVGTTDGWRDHRVVSEMRFDAHRLADHGYAWVADHLGWLIRVEKVQTRTR